MSRAPTSLVLVLALAPGCTDPADAADEGDGGIAVGTGEDSATSDTDTGDDDDDDDDNGDDDDDDDSQQGDTGNPNDPDSVVLVDANCIDGMYVANPPELFPASDERQPIDDLIAGYQPSNARTFLEQVMARRYPTGAAILSMGGDATDQWIGIPPDTPEQLLTFSGGIVHEVGHAIDVPSPESWYFVAAADSGSDVAFTVPGMHGPLTYSASPRFAMERSRLLSDDENAKRPPATNSALPTSAESGQGEFGSDAMFAQIYLTGNPDDESFQMGDQGYNMLMEELVQYINSLAVRHHFSDYAPGTSSDRHALLTWLWWNERYLRKIRAERPEEHAWLLEHDEWLEFILTTWGRAWLYISAEVPGMQPDTEQLHTLVAQPHLLEEIQVLRAAYGCSDPVELLPQYADR